MSTYVPDRGDLLWLELHHKLDVNGVGEDQHFFLSPKTCDGKVGLALFCLVTTEIKGYPFEVQLPDGSAVSGVVLSD